MSVLLNKTKDELIVTCDCGCDESFHIRLDVDDETYALLSYMNSNWYAEQTNCKNIIVAKLKKIWSIIRGKDYHYSDIIMSKEDLKTFADFILNHYTKQIAKEINYEYKN